MRENKRNPYTSARSMENYGSIFWPVASNIATASMGSEYPGIGYVLPIYAVAAILAGATKTRTPDEQAAWDDSSVMKYLNFVPGVGMYNKFKRAGFEDAKQWSKDNPIQVEKKASNALWDSFTRLDPKIQTAAFALAGAGLGGWWGYDLGGGTLKNTSIGAGIGGVMGGLGYQLDLAQAKEDLKNERARKKMLTA